MISLYLPWICVAVLVPVCCVSLYFNYRFAKILLKMEDSLEEALGVLDQRERAISKILEIPLFYDSPQIRQVVDDIRVSRDSILKVAGQIASIEESTYEEENS